MRFRRLVRKIKNDVIAVRNRIYDEDQRLGAFRWTEQAFGVFQEAAEAFMVQNFEAVNLMAIHAKRMTIIPQDLRNYI